MLKRYQLALVALVWCYLIGFEAVLLWRWSFQLPPYNQTESRASEGTKHVGSPSAAEERIADYTLALAWLTGVLAFSTIGLWIATALTLRHSRETAERQLRAYDGLMNDGTTF